MKPGTGFSSRCLSQHGGAAALLLTIMMCPPAMAQAPHQVKVPTWTPVSPQAMTGDDDAPHPVGIVTEQDCQAELEAVVSVKVEGAKLRNHAGKVVSESPQTYRQYLKDLYFQGEGMPRRQRLPESRIREDLQYYEEQARQAVPRCTEFTASCLTAGRVLESRLQACVWNLALSRGGEPARPASTPRVLDCGPEKTAAVNRVLEETDRQIGAWLESPLGRQRGTSTPSLQVVMWGTREQANAIEQHCAAGSGFKERLLELRAAFNAAEDACRTIQSEPRVCVPVAPESQAQ